LSYGSKFSGHLTIGTLTPASELRLRPCYPIRRVALWRMQCSHCSRCRPLLQRFIGAPGMS